MKLLKVKQGETKQYQLAFTNEEGKELSIEGWIVCFTIKNKEGKVLVRVFVKDHEDAQKGKTIIDLSDLHTTLHPKEYLFDIEVKTALGRVYPVKSGTLLIHQEP